MSWPTEQAREAIRDAVAAALDAHKYALYGICACGLDLRADHGRYQQAWRGHLAHEQTEAVLRALAPHVAALVRAERAAALREAADDLEELVDDQHPVAANPDQWLRDRAEAEEADR